MLVGNDRHLVAGKMTRSNSKGQLRLGQRCGNLVRDACQWAMTTVNPKSHKISISVLGMEGSGKSTFVASLTSTEYSSGEGCRKRTVMRRYMSTPVLVCLKDTKGTLRHQAQWFFRALKRDKPVCVLLVLNVGLRAMFQREACYLSHLSASGRPAHWHVVVVGTRGGQRDHLQHTEDWVSDEMVTEFCLRVGATAYVQVGDAGDTNSMEKALQIIICKALQDADDRLGPRETSEIWIRAPICNNPSIQGAAPLP